MEKRRMTTLGLAILSVMAMAVVSVPLGSITPFGGVASAEQPRQASDGGCLPGEEYDPLCDVNRNGIINVVDIMLVASHWRQEGTWASDSWSLTGNAGTTPGSNFLGTTDGVSLTLVVSGTAALRLEPNATSPNFIGGHSANSVTAGVHGATIGGGGSSSFPNKATRNYATVGGGRGNDASSGLATVGGGDNNTASGSRATVGGGHHNTASGNYATVGGGYDNYVTDDYGTVGGGGSNQAGNDDADTTNATYATVGGGLSNTASGWESFACGGSLNTASGEGAVALGGQGNNASGKHSFAAGFQAQAKHTGSFVWADAASDKAIASTGDNQFVARASGGLWLWADDTASTGVILPAGAGSWANQSDRDAKTNFAAVDGMDVLKRLAEMPIETWSYKAQDADIRHIGPSAQDFYAAFGVGEDERYISAVDADGVALAAVQGLYQLSQEQATHIQALEAENATLRQLLDDLVARVAALEGK